MDARGTLPHCYAFVFCERADFDQHNRVTVHRVLNGVSGVRGAHDIVAYICVGQSGGSAGVEVQINLFNAGGQLIGHAHGEIPCDKNGIAQGALTLGDVSFAEPGEYRAELQTRGGEVLASRKIVVEDTSIAGQLKPTPIRAIAKPA